jgi:hypothetical protein
VENDYKPPTLAFDEQGRFICIAVLFGLVIVFAALATLLTFNMYYRAWGAFSVALLWFFVMLLMLLGMGVLNGVNYVSTDTCMYAETFAMDYAFNQVTDPVQRNWVCFSK